MMRALSVIRANLRLAAWINPFSPKPTAAGLTPHNDPGCRSLTDGEDGGFPFRIRPSRPNRAAFCASAGRSVTRSFATPTAAWGLHRDHAARLKVPTMIAWFG